MRGVGASVQTQGEGDGVRKDRTGTAQDVRGTQRCNTDKTHREMVIKRVGTKGETL